MLETLVGSAVGLAVNLIVPPAVASRYAGQALQKLADEIAGLLSTAAAEIPNGLYPDAARRWLDDARRLNRHVPRVDRALAHAEESRQLNLRALAERDRGFGLRDGLEALEHCSVTVRSLFRSVHDAAVAAVDPGPTEADRQRRQQLRRTQAELIGKIGAAVRAFGAMLAAEVDGRDLRCRRRRRCPARSGRCGRPARTPPTCCCGPARAGVGVGPQQRPGPGGEPAAHRARPGRAHPYPRGAAPGPGGRPAAPRRRARSRCCAIPGARPAD